MNRFLFGLIVLLGITLSSCKSSQDLNLGRSDLKKMSPEEILAKNNELPKTSNLLSIKSKVYFKTPKLSDSFKMHVRMKRDSIIWISATYYKVEVARFVFTQDSVKMIDRKNEKYFKGGYNFIQNLYNVPFDFSSLQATLLGEPYDHTSYKKVRAYTSKQNYIVAGQAEREYQKPNGETKTQQQIYTEWYSSNDFQVEKSKITESRTKKSFTAEITERELVEGVLLPLKAIYEITAEEEFTFRTEYLKVAVPETQSYPLTISSKYEPLY